MIKTGLPLLLIVAFTQANAASVIKFNPKQGETVTYRVALSHSEVRSDGNPATKMSNQTPIKIVRQGPSRLKAEIGPLFTLGRSVGRSKIKEIEFSPGGSSKGGAPLPFFVVLPPNGAKVGQKWSAPFAHIAPIPAGLTANYQYVRNTADGNFGEIKLAITQPGNTKVSGTGTLYVRVADGMLDHGAANFQVAFLRPDPANKGKIVVNSRVKIDVKILPK